MNAPSLEMIGIDKSFPGVRVLDNVSLDLYPGEVHALMGENGAGKSTLMKILMGIYAADRGTIKIAGEPVTISSPGQAIRHGIAMIHQELNPVLDTPVYENIFLGRELRSGGVLADRRTMEARTAELLESLHLSIPTDALMRDLSVAQQQQIEIAKAISQDARIIVMDEPTSAITEDDVGNLFEQIRELTDNGVGIIYISHKMNEIFQIADRITVLRDGTLIGTDSASSLTEKKLITMMVGRELDDVFPKREVPLGETVFEVQGWSAPPKVKDVSFTVRRGEILGISGLVGAGRSELVESFFGARPHERGRILRNGDEVRIRRPSDAIALGAALITEDRKRTGLNLEGSVADNITLPSLGRLFSNGLISRGIESRIAGKYIDSLKIKTSSQKQLISTLSGGNQQKVVLAKWLETDPDLIILDDPTRGIDVGAKRDIYELIGALVEQGKSIILISSEMGELMGLADRIMVLTEGRTTGVLERQDFSQEAIMELASRFEDHQ